MISLKQTQTLLIILVTVMFSFSNKASAKYDKLIYDFEIKSISGQKIDFSEYKDKVILLVNVASKCGFTKQYADLQKLWETYKDKGLIVVGFPSNQFGEQEPGTNIEIQKFCKVNFNINFPMTTKINVKGENIEPIYKWALENYGKKAIPKWNFYKILINKHGKIEQTYSSMTNPMSKKMIKDIEKTLN
jgi:glutathione peroxidase